MGFCDDLMNETSDLPTYISIDLPLPCLSDWLKGLDFV
jgi:hypothetical protein